MGWRLARWCWVGVLVGAFTAPASAQVLSKPDAQREAKLREEAYRLYQESDPRAVELLRKLWELTKNYKDLCRLGQAELALGQEREAATTFSKCLTVIPAGNDVETAAYRKMVERFLKLARAQVGAIEVEANLSGAEVFIDDKIMAKLPLQGPIFVDPGRRKVEVRAPGHRSDIKQVEVTAGGSLRLKMQLAEIRPEVVPAAPEQAPPAQKEAEERDRREELAQAHRGAASAASEEGPRTGRLIAGIAMGVVGGGIGVGAVVAATTAYADANAAGRRLEETGLNDPCSAQINRDICAQRVRAGNQIAPMTGLAIGALAIAGAGGVLLFYELVRAETHKPTDSPRAVVSVTPNGGGLWLTGAF